MNNGPFSRFKDSLPGNGVYYCTADKVYENDSAKDLSERIRADKIKGKNSVCIIEGISDIYKDQLKAIQSTFVEFATRHSGRTDQEGDLPRTNQTPVEVYIKAVFYYHTWKGSNADVKVFRTAATEGDIEPVHKPWITHLSYCRITPHCYIFLVDKFHDPNQHSVAGCPGPVSLWTQFSKGRGGLILPQLFSSETYSLYESLKSVFHYDWHFRVLFPHHYHIIRSRPPVTTSTTDEAGIAPIQANTFFYGSLDNASSHDVIPANAMLYLLSNSLWDTNLRLLDSCIQHISFRNLRDPKSETNQKMHDYREALEYLHNSTYEAVKAASASPSLSDSFEELKERYEKSGITTFNPVTFLKTTQKEAEDVQEFLMQTFQLLMSSISVRESGHSAEQASRTTILTYLAILYLPLTVATGVFGMNIKEINNGTPKFFWVIIVMVILMVSTVIVYSLLEKREKRERRKKSKG